MAHFLSTFRPFAKYVATSIFNIFRDTQAFMNLIYRVTFICKIRPVGYFTTYDSAIQDSM